MNSAVRELRRKSRPYSLKIECLEDCWLPSGLVFTVNSAGDNPSRPTAGVMTLRDAMLAVNNDTVVDSPAVITYAIAGAPTIDLLADLPAISRPVIIDGSTQAGVT